MASEQASQKLGKASVGQDMLGGERLPLLCHERNELVTKPAPCVNITDLQKYILDLLEEYDR